MKKELIKAAWVRCYRTFFQVLYMNIPTGIVITPAMIEHFDNGLIYTILAWLATAVLTALGSFIQGVLGGLPEVKEKDD